MTHDTLRELFVENIRDLYDAERQLTKALPKIIKAADSGELAQAVRHHLEETQHQVTRLEDVFRMMDIPLKGKSCKAMKGLIEEGSEAIEDHKDDPLLRDLAIIAAAQKVEHYEVSGYGTVRTLAERLGNDEAARLLRETEDEEGNADKTLTQIALALYDSIGEADQMEDVVGARSDSGGKSSKIHSKRV